MTDPNRPPRDNIVRSAAFELRGDDGVEMPVMTGHFTPFNQWTHIDSVFEGEFMEQIAPGSFTKTFNESVPKVLFQHGRDNAVGDKVLGVPSLLEEDEYGARYEVPLLDTSYNRDILPGLKAGAYGASFRFRVTKEDFNNDPERSDHNPQGLPERTIKEVDVQEFGPVTFPAYAGATAGIRSLTDEFVFDRIKDPEVRQKLAEYLEIHPHTEEEGAADEHSDSEEPGAAETHSESATEDQYLGRKRNPEPWRL